MTPWLTVLATLLKDSGSIPSTHKLTQPAVVTAPKIKHTLWVSTGTAHIWCTNLYENDIEMRVQLPKQALSSWVQSPALQRKKISD